MDCSGFPVLGSEFLVSETWIPDPFSGRNLSSFNDLLIEIHDEEKFCSNSLSVNYKLKKLKL